MFSWSWRHQLISQVTNKTAESQAGQHFHRLVHEMAARQDFAKQGLSVTKRVKGLWQTPDLGRVTNVQTVFKAFATKQRRALDDSFASSSCVGATSVQQTLLLQAVDALR